LEFYYRQQQALLLQEEQVARQEAELFSKVQTAVLQVLALMYP
jgi:hypothetical protein